MATCLIVKNNQLTVNETSLHYKRTHRKSKIKLNNQTASFINKITSQLTRSENDCYALQYISHLVVYVRD